MEGACGGDASLSAVHCTYCERGMDPTGTPSLLERTVDHFLPRRLRKAGLPVPMLDCCWHCNNLKGEMSPEQWGDFMTMNPRWWERPEFARRRGNSGKSGPSYMTPWMRQALHERFPNAYPRLSDEIHAAASTIRGLFPGATIVEIRHPIKDAQPCTNPFLPVGYRLTEKKSGKTAVLGADRVFRVAE